MTTLSCNWYISYSNFVGGPTLMSLTATKEEAITAARKLLLGGINVQEVGPLLAVGEGNVISSDEIRNILGGEAGASAPLPS
jgi:hypothetical protein